MELREFVLAAIKEDVGDGDHSSLASIPANKIGMATMKAKETGIIAGVSIGKEIFEMIDPELHVNCLLSDGDTVNFGDIIMTIEGSCHSILKAERLVLNVMQRMSGVATTTNKYASIISHTSARVLDTRKTTPNMRFFEKEAVKIGGGTNHRFGLYDMIMLKDNHVDFAGGIDAALNATASYLKENNKDLKVEIETRNLEEVKAVLANGKADRIMLDNFTPEETKIAVETIKGRMETESSGGITLSTIKDYAETGVDFVSVGALTHSVKSLDISLIVE